MPFLRYATWILLSATVVGAGSARANENGHGTASAPATGIGSPRRENPNLKCPQPLVTMQKYDTRGGRFSWIDVASYKDGSVFYRCLGETGTGGAAIDPTSFERTLQSPRSPIDVGSPDAMISACLGVTRDSGFEQKTTAYGVIADYHVGMKRLEYGAKGALESIGAIDFMLGNPPLQGVRREANPGYLAGLNTWHDQIASCPRSPKRDLNPQLKNIPRRGPVPRQTSTDAMDSLLRNLESNLRILKSSSERVSDVYGENQQLKNLLDGDKGYSALARYQLLNEGYSKFGLWSNPGHERRRALQLLMNDAQSAAQSTEVQQKIADYEKLEEQFTNAVARRDTASANQIRAQMNAVEQDRHFVLATAVAPRITKYGLMGAQSCSTRPPYPTRGRSVKPTPPYVGATSHRVPGKDPQVDALCKDYDVQRSGTVARAPLLKEIEGLNVFLLLFENEEISASDVNIAEIDALLANPARLRKIVTDHLKDKRKQLVDAHEKMLTGAACLNGGDCQDRYAGLHADESLSKYLITQEGLKYAPKIDMDEESPLAKHFAGDRWGQLAWLKEAQCRQEKRIDAEKTNDFAMEAGVGLGIFAVTLGVGGGAVLLTSAGRTAVTSLRSAQAVSNISRAETIRRRASNIHMFKRARQLRNVARGTDIADGIAAIPAVGWALSHCDDLGMEAAEALPANTPSCMQEKAEGTHVSETKSQKYTSCLSDAALNALPMLQTTALLGRFMKWKDPVPSTPHTPAPPPSGAPEGAAAATSP